MNPRDFLILAQDLNDNETFAGEASNRSVVSRAYYACFLFARHILFTYNKEILRRKENITKIRSLSHTDVQKYLKGSFEDDISDLGQELGELHIVRKDSDYDLDKLINKDSVDIIIDDAENLFESLKSREILDIAKCVEDYYQ